MELEQSSHEILHNYRPYKHKNAFFALCQKKINFIFMMKFTYHQYCNLHVLVYILTKSVTCTLGNINTNIQRYVAKMSKVDSLSWKHCTSTVNQLFM